MKRLMIALLFIAACHREQELPRDTMLWRLDRDWTPAGDARSARVTVLTFRSSGEFVELHCWVIERSDSTVYVASDRPRVVAVGRWTREKDTVTATREKVAGAPQSFCGQPRLTFELANGAVNGDAGNGTTGAYTRVTRLVAPEFESYVRDAKRSPITCVVPEEK